MLNDTMDGKDNLKENTREAADIQMYHFGWNFLQKGFDMTSQWWIDDGWYESCLYFEHVWQY